MRKYHVALSFAGEQRDYVEKVFLYLKEKSTLRVFYDRNEMVSLWGKSIPETLQDIYTRDAHFVVMFVSEEYVQKVFPTLERRFAIDRSIEDVGEYIILARFDDIGIPGLPKSVFHIDLREHGLDRDPGKFAQKIIDKVTQKGLYFGKSLSEDSCHHRAITKRSLSEAVFTIKDKNGSAVAGVDVRLFRQNGTQRYQKSDSDGRVVFGNVEHNKLHTIFLAHPNFRAGIVDNFEGNSDLEITLESVPGIGSAIFESTGYIPGFQGRLNPILDNLQRTYLYADNIAINGNVGGQPVHFKFGNNISLEDCEGNVADIKILRIIGEYAILEYVLHR